MEQYCVGSSWTKMRGSDRLLCGIQSSTPEDLTEWYCVGSAWVKIKGAHGAVLLGLYLCLNIRGPHGTLLRGLSFCLDERSIVTLRREPQGTVFDGLRFG